MVDRSHAQALGARCDLCPLAKLDAPYVPSELNPGAQLAVVAEAPGENEVRLSRPLVGMSGQELDTALLMAGLRRQDASYLNVLSCRPPENRLKQVLAGVQKQNRAIDKENTDRAKRKLGALPRIPTPMACCTPRLLEELRPHRNLLLLGDVAAKTVLGTTASVTAIRGGVVDGFAWERPNAWGIPESKVLVPLPGEMDPGPNGEPPVFAPPPGSRPVRVMPTVHPAFVLRARRWTRVFRADIAKALRWFWGRGGWVPPTVTYHPSAEQLWAFLSRPDVPFWGVDTETDSIEPRTAVLRCIGIGTPEEVMVVGIVGKDGVRTFYEPGELARVLAVVRAFLADPTKVKVLHNWGYDAVVCRQRPGDGRGVALDVNIAPFADTLLLHRLVEGELPHNLGFVGSLYTAAPAWKSDRDGNKIATKFETDEQNMDYNGKDVAVTARVLPPLLDAVNIRNQQHLIPVDHRTAVLCADMKEAGMYVDQRRRQQYEVEWARKAFRLRKELQELADLPGLNPGSWQQVSALLYDAWKLDPLLPDDVKYTESREITTSDVAIRACLLLKLTERQRRFLVVLRDYREAMKLLGTYIVKLRPATVAADDLGWDEDEEPEEREARIQYGERKMGLVDPRTGRVYPGYNPGRAITGRLSSSKPMNCFDAETEILTRFGWVAFPQLPHGVPVAQYDVDTGKITFALPTAYQEYDYDGPMVYFRSQAADLLLTPEHRMLYRKTPRKTEFLLAQSILTVPQNFKTIHAGLLTDDDLRVPLRLTDAEVQLLVAVQADGYWEDGGRVAGFGLQKPRKIERLRALLPLLDLETATEHERPHVPSSIASKYDTQTRFRLRGVSIERVRELLGEYKLFDCWLLRLPARQLQLFADETFHWDGCLSKMSMYASMHRTNADWVQIANLLSGRRANVRLYAPAQGGPFHSAAPSWQVDVKFKADNAITHRAEARELRHYAGKVYCVSTPRGTVIVRRNNRATITGQSQNFPAFLRDMIVAEPGNVLVGADEDQLELRIAAARWQAHRYLEAFGQMADPHSITGLAVFGERYRRAEGFPAGKWVGDLFIPDPNATGKAAKFTGTAKKLRDLAKRVQYSASYGGGADTVHKVITETEGELEDEAGNPILDPATGKPQTGLVYLRMTVPQVAELRDTWLAGVPEYKVGWRAEVDAYRKQGYLLEPVLGRRRDFLDGEDPCEIVNWPIQGSAAAIVTKATFRLLDEIPCRRWGPSTGIITQTHDSLTLEVPESQAEYARATLERCMNCEEASLPGVKFTAKANIAREWSNT